MVSARCRFSSAIGDEIFAEKQKHAICATLVRQTVRVATMCRGINCLLMSAVFIKLILHHIGRTNRLECLVQTMERHNCARKQMNCNCRNYQTQSACQLIGRQHFPFDTKYTGASNPLKAGIAFLPRR